jgi:hypothetical protein
VVVGGCACGSYLPPKAASLRHMHRHHGPHCLVARVLRHERQEFDPICLGKESLPGLEASGMC